MNQAESPPVPQRPMPSGLPIAGQPAPGRRGREAGGAAARRQRTGGCSVGAGETLLELDLLLTERERGGCGGFELRVSRVLDRPEH
jgi:hypothetical protein